MIGRLLLAQSGLGSEAELDAAMRRYQFYCENLPEKVDPPTFMEFLGRANAATHVQSELLGGAKRRGEFESEADLQAFLDASVQERNAEAVGEFEGLTRAEMHGILHGTLADNTGVVTLSGSLSGEDALSSDMVAALKFTLSHLADHDGEVRLTQAGFFPRAMCARYMELHSRSWGPGDSVPSEGVISSLARAHDAAVGLGYVKETRKKAWLTTEGVAIVSSAAWARAFRESLEFMVDVIDWQEHLSDELQHSHFDIVQQSAVFLLLLLRNHPTGTESGLYARFTRAFPVFVEPVQGSPESERLLYGVFRLCVFKEFLVPLGLVQLDFSRENFAEHEGARYQTTDLFRAALCWHR
jgi:hypothetical protein